MFRTIESSEPQPATLEGLQFVTVKSKALRGRGDITLFAPREAASLADVPLVLLLHGVYGSHWAWAVKGRAHQTLQRMVTAGDIPPMALAMPSDGLWGDGSGYLPHAEQNFEQWIVADVPAAAITTLPCVSEKSPRFIAGLSMGGFGALRIGAKYPQQFRGIAGHSSITHFEQLKLFVEEPLDCYHAQPEDHSVLNTLRRHRDTLPAIRFDCGTEDLLIEPNRELHRALTAEGIAHHYEEFPGGHEWRYWETHLKDTLKFFGSVLAVK